MAALATRAERVQQGDYSVTSLPMTGAVGQQFDTWVDAAVSGVSFCMRYCTSSLQQRCTTDLQQRCTTFG